MCLTTTIGSLWIYVDDAAGPTLSIDPLDLASAALSGTLPAELMKAATGGDGYEHGGGGSEGVAWAYGLAGFTASTGGGDAALKAQKAANPVGFGRSAALGEVTVEVLEWELATKDVAVMAEEMRREADAELDQRGEEEEAPLSSERSHQVHVQGVG